MTTEFVLLLGLFAFIFVGAFASDSGPVKVFRNAAPRLGAKVEKSIAVGNHPNGLGFYSKKNNGASISWSRPEGIQ